MAQIRKNPVAVTLAQIIAQRKLVPAYFDLSIEERKEVAGSFQETCPS